MRANHFRHAAALKQRTCLVFTTQIDVAAAVKVVIQQAVDKHKFFVRFAAIFADQ